jgi:hypothetical protein
MESWLAHSLSSKLVGASKEEKMMGLGRAADDDHHWTEVDGSPFVSAFNPAHPYSRLGGL